VAGQSPAPAHDCAQQTAPDQGSKEDEHLGATEICHHSWFAA